MLDWTDPSKVIAEVRGAEEYRDRYLATPRILRRWFAGGKFGPLDGVQEGLADQPEAAVHSYVAMLLPRLVHDNPRVRVTSSMPVTQKQVAPAMKAALDQWASLTQMRIVNERLAMDMILGWGVSYTAQMPAPYQRAWDGEEPWLPREYRISPDFFIMDPKCDHAEEARYMGHIWWCDKDDLIKRASEDGTFDKAEVEALATTSDRDSGNWSRDRPGEDRRQVGIYELWVPEIHQQDTEAWDKAKGDSRVNGTLFTVAHYGGGSRFIRKPRPYYGPRSGPYTIHGAYSVPECPWPLSPIVAVMRQIEMANTMAVAQETAMREYRRILIGDQKTMQDVAGNPLKNMFTGTAQTTQTYEVGGMTAQHVAAFEAAFARLDRALGMSDAMRGNITGDGTATEAAMAQGAANMRIAHVIRQFTAAAEERFRKVAWYMFYDERVKIPVGEVKDATAKESVFTGGASVGLFDALDIRIEPYSMERTNEALAQKRAQDAAQIAVGIANAAVQNPALNGRAILGTLGDALNLPTLADAVDWNRLDQVRASMQGRPNA